MKNKKLLIIISVVIVVALSGGSYFLFMNKSNASENTLNQATAGSSFTRGNVNIGFANGTVNSINGNTVIVDDAAGGGQTIVIVSSTTNIIKSQPSNQSKVVVNGANITVKGTRTGTTIAADSVTLSLARMNNGRARPSGTGQRGQFGNRAGGVNANTNQQNLPGTNNFIGKITAVNGDTVTIKSFGGTSDTVQLSSSTQYFQQIKGSLTDIIPNSKITSLGQKDKSGTIQARNVTIM